jgi:hypothetical protein
MTTVKRLGLIPVGLLLALQVGAGADGTFVALDGAAQPLKNVFNADAGKVRLLMYVSPTCGECLRGAKQGQQQVLATIGDPTLRVYVVWAPKNGGRQQDVGRVTQIVTDPRAAQYWDGHRVLTDAYDRMLVLSGPCAGIFMLYGRDARWEGAAPPKPDYLEDAHAREFNRPYPQYDPQRFADTARAMLNAKSK